MQTNFLKQSWIFKNKTKLIRTIEIFQNRKYFPNKKPMNINQRLNDRSVDDELE